ncbi:MAG: methylated-DNA--[protein]-cysteine S-methyltransferase [Nitrospinota bacterium]|nr:methylated-DNA--[protein]-cysteine S-methyltransferase [Nitrospinota bacterium]
MRNEIYISATSNGIDSILLSNDVSSEDSKKKRDSEYLIEQAKTQLEEYFQGKRKSFSTPLDYSKVSKFSRRVLKEARQIPFGETRTYSWLAKKSGNPKSFRAVGQVMSRNPFLLFVP